MSEFFTKAKEQWLIFWGLILYGVLFSFVGLSSCIMASLVGTTWSSLDPQGKFMICLAVFGNWGTMMMAMLYRSVTKISKGELPISSDDTQLISQRTVKKEQIDTLSVSQPKEPNEK